MVRVVKVVEDRLLYEMRLEVYTPGERIHGFLERGYNVCSVLHSGVSLGSFAFYGAWIPDDDLMDMHTPHTKR